MITLGTIQKRLEEIRACIDDPENAHSLENDLFLDVLEAISNGSSNAQELAEAALKSTELEFPRWCA